MYNKIKSFFKRGNKVDKLYSERNYLDAYKEHTNLRVNTDPKAAIGGDWELLGNLQKSFLIEEGLKPHNSLLDFGCGTLRAGRLLIPYLDKGNYTGIDISDGVIEEAKRMVEADTNLKNKNPIIIYNHDMDFEFKDLNGMKYDFIIAQSVVTHLLDEHVQEIFNNLNRVMSDNSVFYFTAFINDNIIKMNVRNYKDVEYTTSFLRDTAEKNGYDIKECSKYKHPKGQTMFKVIRKNI